MLLGVLVAVCFSCGTEWGSADDRCESVSEQASSPNCRPRMVRERV